jgi:hypothetical protein
MGLWVRFRIVRRHGKPYLFSLSPRAMDCHSKPNLDRVDTKICPQALGAQVSPSQLNWWL